MKSHLQHSRSRENFPRLNRAHMLALLVFLLLAAASGGAWDAGGTPAMLCGLAGWMAAPVALLLAAEGFSRTPCRERYLLVFYLLHMAVSAAGPLVGSGPLARGWGQLCGIASGLFLTVFLLYFFGLVREGMRADEGRLVLFGAAGLLLPAFSGLLSLFAPESPLFLLFPSPFFSEGGLLWPALGVGFSFFMDSKQKTAAFYVLGCSAAALGTGFESGFMLPCLALLFALLPVLLYSGASPLDSVSRHNAGGEGEPFGKCPSDLFTISLQ